MEYLRIITLFILVIVPTYFSGAIGGLIYSIINTPLLIPYFNKVYRFSFYDMVKFFTILKYFTWVIGSSGLLIGLGCYQYFWGYIQYKYEYYILLFICIGIIANFIDTVIFCKVEEFENIFNKMKDLANRTKYGKYIDIVYNDQNSRKSQIYALFIDMYIPQLFRVLVAMGMFYYVIFKLEFIQLKSSFINTIPTLYDCLKYAFSFVPIIKVDNSEIPFQGFVWDCVSISFGIVIFLWALFFITTAPSYFRNEEKEEEKNNELIHGKLNDAHYGLAAIYELLKENLPKKRTRKINEKNNDEENKNT